MSETLLTENGQRSGDSVQKALQVHIDHLFPVRHAELVEPRDRSDAGIADEDIEPAEPGASHLHKRDQVFATLNVRLNVSGFTAGLRDTLRQALQVLCPSCS